MPWGARKFLKWVKDTYNDPEIFITENGVGDDGSTLEDDQRIDFHQVRFQISQFTHIGLHNYVLYF